MADTETVRVRAFARMRELLGNDVVEIEVRDGACVADLVQTLRERFERTTDLLAVTKIARNGRIVGADECIAAGDEIALLPPVSGG